MARPGRTAPPAPRARPRTLAASPTATAVLEPPTPAPTITTTTVAPPPTTVTIAPTAPAPVEAPPAPPRVAARPAIGNVSSCAPRGDDYPAIAVKEEATGTTRVRFTVDAAGKLAGAEVVRSAGASRAHKALDRVAVQKLSECTFRPGIDENGKAVGGTFDVEYVWKLAG